MSKTASKFFRRKAGVESPVVEIAEAHVHIRVEGDAVVELKTATEIFVAENHLLLEEAPAPTTAEQEPKPKKK